MFSTVIYMLFLVAVIVAARLVAWRVLRLLLGVFDRSVSVVKRARTRGDFSELGSRFTARFPKTAGLLQARLTPRRFTGLPLTLIVVGAVYIAALLGGLIEELIEADELVRLDEWINQHLAPLRSDGMIVVFAWITDLGGSATLATVALVTTGLLWGHGRGYVIAPLWLTLIGSQVTAYAGKYAFARQRPEFITEVTAITPSFPSGHATSAIAVYGFVAYIVARDLPGLRQRFEVVYWAAVLIGLVGFSRMLLSVHYASDIAAGFLVGGFWLLVGFAFAEQMRRRGVPPAKC